MKYLFTFISGNALEAADNGGFFSNFIGYDAGSLSSTIFSFQRTDPVVHPVRAGDHHCRYLWC